MGFLVLALLVSALVVGAVVWWHRRPKSMEDSIDEFSRGLQALAPRDERSPGSEPDDPGSERSDRR